MKFSSVALIASTLLTLTAPSVGAVPPRHRFRPGRNSSKAVTAAATAAASSADVCSAGATATETVFVTVGAGGAGGIPAGIGGGNGNGGGAQETVTSSAAGETEAAATSSSASVKATKTKSAKPVVTTAVTTIVKEAPFTATVTITRGGQVVTTKVATTISSVETKVVTVTVTEDAQVTDAASSSATQDAVTAKETASSTEAEATATATDSADETATATDSASETATATESTDETATASGTTSAAEATGTSSTDPQTALRLESRNVMKNLESDGNPGAGEIPSLTSSNNFINHCLLVNKPLTNGQQVKTGSCNTTPMGRLLAKNKLPSSTFKSPPNFSTIPANQAFTIEMTTSNMVTGNFVNAAANYYIAPAQTDASGTLIAHTHVAIQKMDSFDQSTLLDPLTFTFFKGLNDPAVNGIVSTTVAGGVPAGFYRMASINSAANHQPVLSSVEEHGSLDAFSYFQAV